MAEQQFKRHTAYKLRIGDILVGKPVMNGEKFGFLELGDKKIMRVNILGNITDKYESGDKGDGRKYIFLTLDDGSGQIKLKVFGDDSEKFRDVVQGQTVVVIGMVRYWNNETYIAPELVKEKDSKYLMLRKLETEKDKTYASTPPEKAQIMAIKDKILNIVKGSEESGGVELDKLIMDLRDFSPTMINQEIQRLLEEGIVFEPRPGKIRYLG
ncbi:MAG: OB-fold nucleic acid binding domain-containing protein [Nanoarchaeota archaeon]